VQIPRFSTLFLHLLVLCEAGIVNKCITALWPHQVDQVCWRLQINKYQISYTCKRWLWKYTQYSLQIKKQLKNYYSVISLQCHSRPRTPWFHTFFYAFLLFFSWFSSIYWYSNLLYLSKAAVTVYNHRGHGPVTRKYNLILYFNWILCGNICP
jgi:hypothetical protein